MLVFEPQIAFATFSVEAVTFSRILYYKHVEVISNMLIFMHGPSIVDYGNNMVCTVYFSDRIFAQIYSFYVQQQFSKI